MVHCCECPRTLILQKIPNRHIQSNTRHHETYVPAKLVEKSAIGNQEDTHMLQGAAGVENAPRLREVDVWQPSMKVNRATGICVDAGSVQLKTGDARANRISSAKVYANAVQNFRARPGKVAQPIVDAGSAGGGMSKVFLRARPIFEHEVERGEWDCVSPLGGGVVVHEGHEGMRSGHGFMKKLCNHEYATVGRIDDDEGVYNRLSYLVRKAAAGTMSTLFMYGMTGSGKTYSANIIQQKAPDELFDLGGTGATVELIAYELIGKRCFDLLVGEDQPGAFSEPRALQPTESKSLLRSADDTTVTTAKAEVHLRVGADGATHVSGSTVATAHDPAELRGMLARSSERRETSATGTNATSSRSHAVYCMRTRNGGSFTLIDLAGNEGNIETAFHSKEQMKEAAEINSSLMALRSCLQARAMGSSHIPFRESVLTRVLRDALLDTNASPVAVLACVSPACSHYERTIATVRSAVTLMGHLKPAPYTEDYLKEISVQQDGPTKWTHEILVGWVQSMEFADRVQLPPATTGASIMKLTVSRLATLCGCDTVTAKALFGALRAASKEAAQRDRAKRKELKSGPKPTSSMAFSKEAPALPVVPTDANGGK
jgi:kinesin family protein 2/24